MKLSEKSKQLALVVWFNLFIGLYNLYIYRQDSKTFNLVIGIFNIGVWVFLRSEVLRQAYLKKKS
tara:strand:+ start:136 stop:330 length:195 start_codon:yes stop_codon:yes gene_type:complete